ncbi:1934_t:CDS:1, partial [Gigaspora margarita]
PSIPDKRKQNHYSENHTGLIPTEPLTQKPQLSIANTTKYKRHDHQ